MALHPQAEFLIDAARVLDLPTPPDLDPEVARETYNHRTDAITDIVEMKEVIDRTIPGPGGEIPIRVFRPIGAGATSPGLVFFHGGGWVFGSLDSYDPICRVLADTAKAVVVSVDYRLAPEHPHPAAVDDCLAATRWLADSASELGIDPARLAISGDSAGGNLAAIVAQECRDTGTALTAQVLVYPMTELAEFETGSYHRNGEGMILTRDFITWFLDHYVPDLEHRRTPRCSPARGALDGLPPTLVVTAEYDPLVDDGHAYANALASAGVETELYNYDGQIHSFFTQVGIVDASRDAAARIAAFLEGRW